MDKKVLPPKRLPRFFFYFNFSINFFAKLLIFKPHNENGLSLWSGSTRKHALENNGHVQAQLFMKSFDASFRNTLAINHSVEMWKNLSEEKTMKL